MDWGFLLFSFQGRVNRAKYWLLVLFMVLAIVAGSAIGYALFGLMGAIGGYVIAALLILWPGLTMGVKRLHDRDKSGWWLLVFYVVPAVLNQISTSIGNSAQTLPISVVSFGISIWALVELGCLRGTVGPNQYGPDPLGTPELAASHF